MIEPCTSRRTAKANCHEAPLRRTSAIVTTATILRPSSQAPNYSQTMVWQHRCSCARYYHHLGPPSWGPRWKLEQAPTEDANLSTTTTRQYPEARTKGSTADRDSHQRHLINMRADRNCGVTATSSDKVSVVNTGRSIVGHRSVRYQLTTEK